MQNGLISRRGAALWLSLAATPVLAQTSTPATPPAAPAQAKPSPANDNPFPEEESKAAAKEADAAEKAASNGPAPDADAPAESSSSSRTRMKGLDLLGDHDPRTSDGAGNVVNDPQLAKEDVRVGQLYMGDGNYPGAYARFKEATVVGPGNPDVVFFLAEAARKTAHLDEAAANYKLYLEAEPKGKRAKDARRALTELSGK